MALTQISTAGVKDDAVTAGKIPANAVGSSELADNAVDTAAIADDAVTDAKLANSINTAIAANTAKASITINNEADNRVITATGTSNTIQGEPNVTVGLQGDLHIKDPGNTAYTNFTGGTDAGIIIGNGLLDSAGVQLRTGTSGSCKLNFGDGDGSSSDRSKGFVHYTHSDNSMQIGTNSSERLRLDSSGNLLLGTTTAAAGDLVIKDKINAGNTIWMIGRASDGTSSVSFRNNADSAYLGRIQTDSSNGMQFQVGGSERGRIDSSGRVLIGTTTEGNVSADDLTVAGSGNQGITIRSGTGGSGNLFFSDGTSGGDEYRGYLQYQHSTNKLAIGTNATTAITIDSSGKAGVGTTSPSTLLHIQDTAIPQGYGAQSGTLLVLEDSGDTSLEIGSGHNNTSSIFFGDTGASNKGRISYHNGTGGDAMAFHANDSERMRIDSSGRVIKSNQPAFLAYHNANDLTYTSGDTLAYKFEVFDIGSNYNTSNYTFTAPIAGRYLFSANANAAYDNSLSGVPRAYWKINGSNVANSIHLRGSDNLNTGSDADGLEQRSQTVIFNLAANDTVRIDVGQNKWDLFGANSFCGYLLG